MCGIWGAFGDFSLSEVQVQRQHELISHRGPDGKGEYLDKNIAMGHSMLAIQDPGNARQPMASASKDSLLVFNGEIYNFRELREKHNLMSLRTNSDTEVLLELLELKGKQVLSEIHGMFAFAFYSFSKDMLILGRDFFGEKPLFFGVISDHFHFSSDPRAVAQAIDAPLDIEREKLGHLLKYLYLPEGSTFFRGVQQVPPGATITIDRDLSVLREDFTFAKYDEEEKSLELREVIRRSTRSTLVSDVPIGLSLSGGLDSGMILAEIAADGRQIETFHFRTNDDDLTYSRELSQKFGTVHHEVSMDDFPIETEVEWLLRHQPLPFGDNSILPVYLLSKYSRQFVKVLLSGDGGDEMFFGYDYYAKYFQTRSELPNPRNKQTNKLSRKLSSLTQNLLGYSGSNANEVFVSDPLETWFNDLAHMSNRDLSRLIGKDLEIQKMTQKHFEKFQSAKSVLKWDQTSYLPGNNLWKSDTAGMMASLEIRTPFLSPEIYSVSNSSSFGNYRSKKDLVSKEYKKVFSDDFVFRRKRGFGAPLGKVFTYRKVNELVGDFLLSSSSRLWEHLDKNKTRSAIKNNQYVRWNLLALTLWLDENA